MTKTALLKLFVAIVITIILILPEYFKTPKGNVLELSCLEVCLQHNFTYSLSVLNFSFMTLLQPVREGQIIRGIFLNQSSFQNFTKLCQDIMSEFKMCSSCLVCESKGNMDFISQEQTSKASIVDPLEEYNITCNLNTHTRKSAIMVEDSAKENSINHSCRITEGLNSCIHVSLHLEMDIKSVICSMKITWYVLVLLIFILLIIFVIHKILEGHRRMQKWQSHKYKPTSVLLRESDSEKLRTLNVRVILGEFYQPLKNRRDHAEAAPDSGQHAACSNTRTRSHFCNVSVRSTHTI
ncbi:transmembrane protein 156 isoform X3 [Trichechus manatus latirostris]|uniref:Transmembrane protein 156 isoform X3 n=1 Tax=Trichechus manatus latirostris TaxID=127582 RepID=A0A2Y9RSW9_TRIMA|nr:transmembrane protein 156 isoform X3 [Trichechus manatus latirostris]